MNKSMLKHLNNLYNEPLSAWKYIDREQYANKWKILKENLLVFLIINPVLFMLIHTIQFKTWQQYLLKAFFYPVSLTIFAITFIVTVSLIVEEIFRLTSYRDPEQSVMKLFVFSSLPFFTVSGLMDLPFFGNIFLTTGIVYSLYILKTGFDKYLWVYKSSRRAVFFIASMMTLLTCLTFTGILFKMTQYILKKVINYL